MVDAAAVGAHGDDLVVLIESSQREEGRQKRGDRTDVGQDGRDEKDIELDYFYKRRVVLDDVLKRRKNIDDDVKEDKSRQARKKAFYEMAQEVTV
jgi:hypothetical protein